MAVDSIFKPRAWSVRAPIKAASCSLRPSKTTLSGSTSLSLMDGSHAMEGGQAHPRRLGSLWLEAGLTLRSQFGRLPELKEVFCSV